MIRMFRSVLLIGVLVIVGCSGESAAPDTTTSSTTTSTTEATTTTSTTTTTTSSSTTLDPESEIEAEVEAAYLRAYEVFVECYRTLPECDPQEAFPAVYADPTLARQVIGALDTKADGFVYEAPINPAHERSEVIDISVGDEGMTATVSFCTLAGDREFSLGADGSRTLTSDTVLVEWGDVIMTLGSDDVWRLSDFPNDVGGDAELTIEEVDQQIEEGTLCDGSGF